jgi:transcriptional regulator with XRE-family HTH domain
MIAAMWDQVAKKIRALRGTASQVDFGFRLGVEQATVSRWEKGKPVDEKHRKPIADLAGVSVAEFFSSEETPRLIPIVGYVSGGEKFAPIEDGPPGVGIDNILVDIGDEDQVAVRVRGDSMRPVYRDGDVIIGSRIGRRDLDRAVGRDCIIKTANGDGYVKVVHKGAKRGLFRLRSYNPAYDDVADVELEWAAPIIWVRRSH